MADQSAAETGCRIDRIDFQGWQAVRLSNGIVDLVPYLMSAAHNGL